jgi:dTDP-4-amino-4,6-dideoxygalactose transaminase
MAFEHAGFTVRVADVDPRTLMLTPHTVAPLLSGNTAAVVAVHLYGQYCAALPALRQQCDAAGVALIEDCAHRLDLLDAAAPLGDYACYSFNAVKEVPCSEGGVLWGRDARDDPYARSLSNVGLGLDTMQRAASARHADYQFASGTGLKLRLNDLAASLANGALPSLADARAERRAQFARYDELIGPLAPAVRPLARNRDDSCLMYVVLVCHAHRDRIRHHLADCGIATSVHYPSLARHPLFGAGASTPPTSVDADGALVTLPSFLEMTPAQQHRVAEALARACADPSESAQREPSAVA